MKQIAIAMMLLLGISPVFAKKVTFSVDMTGQVISPNGIHVMGDFQAIAGLGTDWTPDNALMTPDAGNPMMYRLTVDIPAFAKYEFKFVNGDQGYEVEVVPDKARVGYNNVDNRWIYIDSLANDTTKLPEYRFNESSPAGMTLMRYIVDMTLQTVSPQGVHISGDFNAWNANADRLYSFGNNAYEIILYGTAAATYNYKFVNGNAAAASESVPASCAIAGNRQLVPAADSIVPKVCFSACSTCFPAAMETAELPATAIYPNPMNDVLYLEFNDGTSKHKLSVLDLSGRVMYMNTEATGDRAIINRQHWMNGVYILRIEDANGRTVSHKLSVE